MSEKRKTLVNKLETLLEVILKVDPMENELIQSHLFDLLQLDEEALQRFLVKYEEIAKSLRSLLSSQMDYTFTTQHYNQVLAQVEAGILEMKKALNEQISDNEVLAQKQAIEHILSEITLYEPTFQGSLQNINVRVAEILDNVKTFRMQIYQSSVDKYGLDIIGKAQDILVKGILSQKFHSDLISEIMEYVDGREWKAREIMRTELLNAYNEAALVSLQESAKELPGLKKQWLATLDGRTGQDSIALNGQIREVDKPFDYAGKPIDRPPTRPNCRCRVIPYKEDWEKGGTENATTM